MITRFNCFETNSSSTHALCIGRGKFQEPYILINKFLHDNYFEYYNDDTIEKYNKYIKPINNKKDDRENGWNRKPKIILRRFKNIGRTFDIYDSPDSKLNFLWTCLVMCFNYDKNRINYDAEKMLYNFIDYIYSLNVPVKFIDLSINSKKSELRRKDYNDFKDLFKLDNRASLPKELKNKYFYGEETYGYAPMKEIEKILNNPILFWNLIFGDSKIYTGSDERDSFEDLNLDHYKYKLVGGSDYGSCETENVFSFEMRSQEKKIGEYENGNYKTIIYSDGTRTRELVPTKTFYNQGLFKEEFFGKKEIDLMDPEFPESIDLKITNYCGNKCKFCYIESNTEGSHADKERVKEIISQMKPYTEIAIGGGNPITHPDLEEILEFAKERNIICNITLKDIDVMMHHKKLIDWFHNKKLINAVGISPTNIDFLSRATELISNIEFVIHLVLGIHNKDFMEKVFDRDNFQTLLDKILILGYKKIGKGKNYFENNEKEIIQNIKECKELIENKINTDFSVNDYRIIAFDNLAINQLNLDVNDKYKDMYQGDDGKFSFYIDAVKETYAKSSLEENQQWFFTIKDSFENLKKGE